MNAGEIQEGKRDVEPRCVILDTGSKPIPAGQAPTVHLGTRAAGRCSAVERDLWYPGSFESVQLSGRLSHGRFLLFHQGMGRAVESRLFRVRRQLGQQSLRIEGQV